jgi:hypothetical protein
MAIVCEGNRLRSCPIRENRPFEEVSGESESHSLERGVSLNQNKYHPYLYHLRKIPWAIFGTLTWSDSTRRRDTPHAEWLRCEDFKGLIGATCGQFRLRRKNLALYHALEWGKAEECHFHFLIAKNGVERVAAPILAETVQNLWRFALKPFDGTAPGIGLAVVKPYDDAQNLNGVDYCLKREFDSKGQERERFDFLSKSLLRLIERRAVASLN